MTLATAARTLLDIVRLSTTYLTDHGCDSARLDAELVCAHALGLRRLDLYLQFDRPLDDPELAAIRELVRRRGRGEPVAYITGEREFYGRGFHVTPDVLIPRPETETLVDRAVRSLREHGGAMRIADLGTGSGCIAVSLGAEMPGIAVIATDVSAAALAVARRNAGRHAVDVTFVECSWAESLAGVFDIVVSNPPYVTTEELEACDPGVRDYEPHAALLGGGDGLDAYRELLESMRGHVDTARLLLEIDPRRADAVAALVGAAFAGSSTTIVVDLAGRARVVDATLHT